MSFVIEEIIFDAIKILRSPIHSDHRGFFEEMYRADAFIRNGIPTDFIQDNHSRSRQGVIRGMHAQHTAPMGKLVHVVRGQIQLVEIDIRKGSPTFGNHVSIDVSDVNARTVWIPPGFANGFAILSEEADVHYKCTALYNPSGEIAINPLDPQLGIRWLIDDPILSDKDKAAMTFAEYAQQPMF